ncbi:hypothetical protein C8Q70DRAFT_195781 [Cubamyces menziesii]|uniref:Transmembrane protein n=1 Tax=Trametes cubensis TaxID=1111947 RepID=A0AAD7TX32_9APHY|nr:hypothetical protein C8Q70DRAFT_195781 [Cubamyces menziesii]KAJ8487596.1 hypothetical protein ONZ51_g4083 [Trametes cubensis]
MLRTMSSSRIAHAFVTTLSLMLAVSAILVNHTIDDQAALDPAVLYYSYGWQPGQTCPSCLIPPGVIDSSKAYDGTWYYTGVTPTAIVASFTGSAVYVYNILPNTVPSHAMTIANLSFNIDGVDVGQFVHIPDSTSTVLYNVSVFAAAGLANAAHILTISVQGENASHILFDYLVYTSDEPGAQNASQTSSIPYSSISLLSGGSAPVPISSSSHPPPSAPTPVGVIVGGVIGGVATLLLAALLSFLLCGSKKHRHLSRALPSALRELSPESDPALFEATREREDRRLEQVSISSSTRPHPHLSQPHLHIAQISPASAVSQPQPSPSSISEVSRTSQCMELPRTSMFSNTASVGASNIDPSKRSGLQSKSDTDIVKLWEEFKMSRDRVTERLRSLRDPPPVYEEPRHVAKKDTSG